MGLKSNKSVDMKRNFVWKDERPGKGLTFTFCKVDVLPQSLAFEIRVKGPKDTLLAHGCMPLGGAHFQTFMRKEPS